jgi:hypothetical protein
MSAWLTTRRFHAESYNDNLLKRAASVAVILVTSEAADTIADVLHVTVRPLVAQGIVDELLVIDMDSRDGTVERVESSGARMIQADAVLSSFGPARGRGDAMWRAVARSAGPAADDGRTDVRTDGATVAESPRATAGGLLTSVSEGVCGQAPTRYSRRWRIGETR